MIRQQVAQCGAIFINCQTKRRLRQPVEAGYRGIRVGFSQQNNKNIKALNIGRLRAVLITTGKNLEGLMLQKLSSEKKKYTRRSSSDTPRQELPRKKNEFWDFDDRASTSLCATRQANTLDMRAPREENTYRNIKD